MYLFCLLYEGKALKAFSEMAQSDLRAAVSQPHLVAQEAAPTRQADALPYLRVAAG